MYTITSLKQQYDTSVRLLIELLRAKGCWHQNQPEIPEEISAQFDLPLETAQNIVNFFHEKL